MKIFVLSTFLLLGIIALLPGQDDNEDLLGRFISEQMTDAQGRGQQQLPVTPPGTSIEPNDELMKALNDAWAAYYGYLIWTQDQQKKGFEWQLKASKAIFWVVVALVGSGVILAAFQFWLASRREESLDDTELEISGKGLKLKSSIIGLVVLIISLLFYYLYLVHVYPITIVSTGG